MSAWIVPKGHIDVLVQALIAEDSVVDYFASDVGMVLWRENVLSVAARYPYDGDGERPGPADFRDANVVFYSFIGLPGEKLDDYAVHKAIGCYRYQSCEHLSWQGSQAEVLTRHLNERIESRIPAEPGARPKGWDDWPWGFESIEQAVKREVTA